MNHDDNATSGLSLGASYADRRERRAAKTGSGSRPERNSVGAIFVRH